MWVYDLETLAFLEVNGAAVEKYGYSKEEFLKLTLKDIRPPEDVPRLLANLATTIGPLQHSAHWRHTLKNGRIIEVEISSHTLSYHERNAALVTVQDITERKRTEEQLRYEQGLLRTLIDNLPDAIYAKDSAGRKTLANLADVHNMGFHSEAEVLGKNDFDLFPTDVASAFSADDRTVIETGQPVLNREEYFIDVEGQKHWLLTSKLPMEDDKGQIIGLIGIGRDITERKKAEESQLLLTTALESTANGVVITDLNGEIVWVNKAFTGTTGYTLKEALGQNPRILKSGTQDDSLYNDLWKTISAGNVWHGELLNKKKDGSLYTDDTTITPLKKANGKITHFIAIKQNITERKKLDQALSQSERRFHQLFDEAPVGYHELDIQGRIVEVNRTEQEMLGYRAEEMLGHPAWEFIVDREASRKAIEAQIAGSVALDRTVENTFQRKDGTILNVLLRNRTLRNEAKGVVGIRSALQDITERKKADRELRLMAQTLASARDCISITDLENRLLYTNDAFREMYGYTTDELTGKDVSLVRSYSVHPAIIEDIFQETLAGGWHGEVLNRRKDGSDLPVELWTSIVRDDAGTPVAMVGIARDISERKNSEAQLKQSEQQFRLIAENVADMIAVLDLNGRRIYNSPSYNDILGNPESLKETDGFREIHPEDKERIKQVFQETVRTGVGQRLEYRLMGKDGSTRNIESKGSVIRDAEGVISQVIVVSRDVTEEKRLAAQFLRAQRMESIGTLAGGIAHDLNNVLAPIMMAIEVLRTKISDPGGQKILNTIETSAKRGADIVRQVLAFGRGVKSDRILVQLKHLIQEVAKIAGETFPKAIEIKTDIARNLWTVAADPTQMHQVLLNLLVNARDAMPKGGTLTIAAQNIQLDENYSRMHLEAKPGAYVSMAITDTGTGIPADIQEKIFEPFFTTKEIGLGTGLGLSTTLAIVKSHEGFINLRSERGKGTTFSIYIPATGTDSGGAAASEVVDLPMGHGELILIIDDEAAIREITKETLEAYGYKAITASDGAEGISVFSENKKVIKAVIIDIMMPVMDGSAAILVLNKIDPDVKIIAASGLTTKGQVTPPPASSVQGFLTKPYTAENLLKTLKTVLR